jgi:hypothetical protein
VIALDGDDGDARRAQQVETRDGVVHRFGFDLARIEEVARDEHEINLAPDGVGLDYVEPRFGKVLHALVEIVAATAQVHVRDVEELHNNLSRACAGLPG